jgi:type IV secretion system protein VirB10
MSELGTSNPVTPPPELHQTAEEPKGVLQKNLKPLIYLGAAALVIVAAVFSSTSPNNAAHKNASLNQPPQPMLQDTTEANVQDLKNQVAASQQQKAAHGNPTDPATAGMTPAQQAAAAAYAPNGRTACAPGQPCSQTQGGYMQEQLSPVQQQEQQLAAHDRELAYASRFASNLVYSNSAQAARQQAVHAAADGESIPATAQDTRAYAVTPERAAGSLVLPRAAGEQSGASVGAAATQRKPEVNIDSATGQPYVIYEGTTLDTVLMNRLDGDAAGPVKVLVSNPVYSHDRQHVLIPEGTIVLGEARKIGSSGFGQQRRMAVVFHRMIMPDGYSVDLDQVHGLDQIGQEGLKDKVNNHYLQIFGTSIVLGIIAGAGEIEQGGGTISTSGSQAFATGAASSISQSATTVLDRFLQIPPTITIREGHRVKVYFTQDMLLPGYERHTIPQTF